MPTVWVGWGWTLVGNPLSLYLHNFTFTHLYQVMEIFPKRKESRIWSEYSSWVVQVCQPFKDAPTTAARLLEAPWNGLLLLIIPLAIWKLPTSCVKEVPLGFGGIIMQPLHKGLGGVCAILLFEAFAEITGAQKPDNGLDPHMH